PPIRPSSSNSHILIIDDEDNLRYIMSNILELNNYVVTAVDNGRVALEKLQTNAYDLILCDINMPDMNGREFFDKLRSELDMAHYRARVVFITGDVLQKETRTFLEQAQAPCLHKPFDIADLLQVVQAKLNGSTGDSA
ncbi:MAG: response regulator, partial [Anaerolineales bacterium]|nr:response regulator [Anaerolineales bacterium]